MTRGRSGLTPYLSAALRLGGPGCERAFLDREARSLLRGLPREALAVRGSLGRDDDPEPAPRILRLRRKAA